MRHQIAVGDVIKYHDVHDVIPELQGTIGIVTDVFTLDDDQNRPRWLGGSVNFMSRTGTREYSLKDMENDLAEWRSVLITTNDEKEE